jgi:hypothetical protein
MSKALELNGGYSSNKFFWKDLQGKTITNNTVILSHFGDIHPFENPPNFTCKTLH